MVIYSTHLCILIYAQNNWKDKDYEQFSDMTLVDYLGKTEHSDCEVCLTCPVCRADWELFDPENPGEYVQFCEYCEVLLPLLKEHLTGDGFILFSHRLVKLDALKQFIDFTLSNKKIKKVFVIQQYDPNRKPAKATKMLGQIKHQELKQSEFLTLIEAEKFEYNNLYEVFKDKYY